MPGWTKGLKVEIFTLAFGFIFPAEEGTLAQGEGGLLDGLTVLSLGLQ